MKILFLIPNLNIGGAEKYVVTLSNELFLRGHQIFLCTINGEGVLKRELNDKINYYELSGKSTIKKVYLLNKIIKQNKIETVHSHLFKSDLLNYVSFTNMGYPIKKISTEHSSSSKRKRYKIFGFIQKILYKKFDRIIAISNSVNIHIVEWSGIKTKKVITIYNGTDMPIIATEELGRKFKSANVSIFHIATLARLENRKDIKTALRAIKDLVIRLQYTNFIYTIYGDGPEKENLIMVVKELQIEKYVVFAGFIDNIKEIIDSIDIHIISSLEEGFGISVIETMARGIPNIATRTGGIPEVISDKVNGFLFNCGDYEDLANKIYSLITDEKLKYDIALLAKNRVLTDFSMKSNVDRVLEIYQQKNNWEEK